MSFVDVPMTTTVEREVDPALADRIEAGRLRGCSVLQILREDRALSTVELARLAGLRHDEVVGIESGKPMSALQLQAIAAALDVPADMLAG